MAALAVLFVFAYAPSASAAQLSGGFSIGVCSTCPGQGAGDVSTFQWVDVNGNVTTLNLAAGFDFETVAGGGLTPGVPGAMIVVLSSGSFTAVAPIGTEGLIKDFAKQAMNGGLNTAYPIPGIPTSIVDFELLDTGLSVEFTGISSVLTQCSAGCDIFSPLSSVIVNGTVIFHAPGFEATPGFFTFAGSAASQTFSFNAVNQATPVPEPMTLVLLGAGLVTAGVTAARKRR